MIKDTLSSHYIFLTFLLLKEIYLFRVILSLSILHHKHFFMLFTFPLLICLHTKSLFYQRIFLEIFPFLVAYLCTHFCRIVSFFCHCTCSSSGQYIRLISFYQDFISFLLLFQIHSKQRKIKNQRILLI